MDSSTSKLMLQNKHRYKIMADIYNIRSGVFEDVILFLDSGCYNTMVPKYFAETSGRPLGFKHGYKIGGAVVEAQAYSIEKIKIGDVVLERVVAFAADYGGDFASDIILGTNVMNNWRMTIDKKANTFQFCENPLDDLPNKKYIYQNYFDKTGNYVCIQETA